MAVAVTVQCINKTARYDSHERIRAIGGVNPNGARWMSQLNAVDACGIPFTR